MYENGKNTLKDKPDKPESDAMNCFCIQLF